MFSQTIGIHKSTYKVNGLMFGVKVALSAWQRVVDQILQDLKEASYLFADTRV